MSPTKKAGVSFEQSIEQRENREMFQSSIYSGSRNSHLALRHHQEQPQSSLKGERKRTHLLLQRQLSLVHEQQLDLAARIWYALPQKRRRGHACAWTLQESFCGYSCFLDSVGQKKRTIDWTACESPLELHAALS